MGKSVEMTRYSCLQCGDEFEVLPYRVRRGNVKFCSNGCSVRYRNLHDNPTQRPEVRQRISENHHDVSGERNPMFGRSGLSAPSYIDGRDQYAGDTYRGVALANKPHVCEVCGCAPDDLSVLHIHHIDKDRTNNDLDNLQVVCIMCHYTVIHVKQRDRFGRFMKEADSYGESYNSL